MKYCCLILSLITCFTLFQCAGLKNEPSREMLSPGDVASIKLTIMSETEAFANRDSIKLMSFYFQDDITQSAWNNRNGTFSTLKGFDAIQANFSKAFKSNPNRMVLPNIDRNGWYFKKLSPEWVWVNFTQKIVMTDSKEYVNYETRLMKKINGEWKLAVMYSLGDHGIR
jgi:hypothetical protein